MTAPAAPSSAPSSPSAPAGTPPAAAPAPAPAAPPAAAPSPPPAAPQPSGQQPPANEPTSPYEAVLPEAFQPQTPAGMTISIDAASPRFQAAAAMATELGLDQQQFSRLLQFDVEMRLAEHTALQAELAAERKTLGDKGDQRLSAVAAWAKGLKDKGEITAAEFEEISLTASSAAGVTLLEKIIAKANGNVPGAGHGTTVQPKPSPPPRMADRWYSR
jgi:hypothetical protein